MSVSCGLLVVPAYFYGNCFCRAALGVPGRQMPDLMLDISHTAEAHIRRCAIGRVAAARRHPVAVAV